MLYINIYIYILYIQTINIKYHTILFIQTQTIIYTNMYAIIYTFFNLNCNFKPRVLEELY